jgi:hypothetical protein
MKKNSGNILFILVLLFVIAICGVGLKSRLHVDRNLELLYGGCAGCTSCSNRVDSVTECKHFLSPGSATCQKTHCIENRLWFAKCNTTDDGSSCSYTSDSSQIWLEQRVHTGAAGLCGASYNGTWTTHMAKSSCSPQVLEIRCKSSSCPGDIFSSQHRYGRYKCQS